MTNKSKRMQELETLDRARSEKKVRKEKTMVTVANLTPDNRDVRGEQLSNYCRIGKRNRVSLSIKNTNKIN